MTATYGTPRPRKGRVAPVEQCTARSKQTGERCKRRVRGGGVCRYHGGAASQVKAMREQRVAMAELLATVAEDPNAPQGASPAEVMVHAMDSAHRVLRLLGTLGLGENPSAGLKVLGEWIERAGRAAALVVASKADELVIAQAERVSQGQARQFVQVLGQVLSQLALSEQQQARIPGLLADALAAFGLVTGPISHATAPKALSGARGAAERHSLVHALASGEVLR